MKNAKSTVHMFIPRLYASFQQISFVKNPFVRAVESFYTPIHTANSSNSLIYLSI